MIVIQFCKILFIFSFVDVIYGSSCIENSCSVWPDRPVNLTYDQGIAKYKEIAPRVWKQTLPLTPLGCKFKDIVLNLIENGNEDTSLLCALSSIFFNNFVTYLDKKPDACMMAAMVNGTVSYHNDHDDTLAQSALTKVLETFYHIGIQNIFTARVRAGCDFRCGKSPPDPEINRTNCYKDGFCYPIEDLFNIPERPYCDIAPELKNIVLKLYKSKNYIDKFIASSVAFSLSGSIQRTFVKLNPLYIIEAFLLQMSDPIKQKCCYSRINRAEEIRNNNAAEAARTNAEEREYLRSSKCELLET